jgi:hypothetical protein
MPLPQPIRALVPLVIGLVVGGAGAVSFLQSMPGAEGSPEERAARLEAELKTAKNRILALEAANSQNKPRGVIGNLTAHNVKQTLADGARRIGEDVKAGRPVSPDDIFKAAQPLMRDLAPLFDRMRLKEQKQMIERMTGELARKYNLTQPQQDLLKQWFEKKSAENAKQWSAMIGNENTKLADVMRASRDVRPDEGLDAFMPSILTADKLGQFKTDRLNERARQVQQEADTKVQRLSSIVNLDEAQRDQVFGIMARNSKNYDPQMAMEGAGGAIAAAPVGDRQQAILSVLRPDQRASYETEQQRRRDEAAKDMEAMGLTLPADWEMLGNDFQ